MKAPAAELANVGALETMADLQAPAFYCTERVLRRWIVW